MAEPTIRLYFRDADGKLDDGQQDFDLAFFGGQLPVVGDMILDPGVLQGLDRRVLANRRMWTVVARVFNPRDLDDYIALVVEERTPTEQEESVVVG